MTDELGPLTPTVLEYDTTIKRLVRADTTSIDWAPLAKFVAIDEFERIGTFLEVQNWEQYTEMLSRWASATGSFETTVRRVVEVAGFVYYEIEERHFRGDDVTIVNSMTVFEFDEAGKIRHLAVYLQQPR